MDKATTTQAPFTLVLGQHSFQLRPLTDEDNGELDQWVRSHYLQCVRDAMALAPMAERQEALKVAFAELPFIKAFGGVGSKLMASLLGLAKLVQVSSKTKVPLANIVQALRDPEAVSALNAAIDALNPVPKGNAATRAQGPGSKTVRSTRRSQSAQGGPSSR